jgi:hypothetical protein
MVLAPVVVRVFLSAEVLELLTEGEGGLAFFLSHLNLNQDIIFSKVG